MTRARGQTVRTDLPMHMFTSYPEPKSTTGELKKLSGRLVISPLFLLASLFILYFVPGSVLRANTRSELLKSVGDALYSAIDVVASLILLLFFSPFFFLVGILTKIESKGPIFHRQELIGKNHRKNGRKTWLSLREPRVMNERRKDNLCGRPFRLYRFRTIRNDTELSTSPVRDKEEDARPTRIGKLLRSTHMDELPQLINVLKGDMSVVGPRPASPSFCRGFAKKISEYSVRFCVKPGITGLAQIKRFTDCSMEDVRKALKYDIFYCQKRCLLLRIEIILVTIRWAWSSAAKAAGQKTNIRMGWRKSEDQHKILRDHELTEN